MSEHIDRATAKAATVWEVVEAKIETAIAQNKPLPVTKLAKEIAPMFNMEWPQTYHLINLYVSVRDELAVKHGPRGGISLRQPIVVAEPSEQGS